MPRVLILTPELALPGGVSQYCAALRPFLPSGIDYLTTGRRQGERSSLGTLVRLAADYAACGRAVLRGGYRIVQVNPSMRRRSLVRDAGFCLLAKLAGRRLLVFFHGWDPQDEPRRWRWLRPIYFRADAIVVLAESLRQHLRSMGYRRTIYVETTTYEPAIESARNGGPFSVLFLARLLKAKGLYEAIDAYAIARARCPNMRLTIAGDGAELAAARDYVAARRLPDVTFTGFVTGTRKQEVFAGADCYLLPSYSEGMPCAVLEAMAHGLAVITRPVGGLVDFFENGRMGFLEPSLDPERFAGRLLELASNRGLCSQFGAYNRRYALAHFSAPTVAARLGAIYEALVQSDVGCSPHCG